MSDTQSDTLSDTPTNIFGTTKVGRVMVAVEAFREEPAMVQKIMKYLIIFNARLNPKAETIDCVAISEEFDELQSQEQIPTYTAQIHHDGHVTFLRTSYKRNVPESVKDEIMKTIMEHNVNLEDFKHYVLQFDPNTKEEDFTTYDGNFLEALLIYVNRNLKK